MQVQIERLSKEYVVVAPYNMEYPRYKVFFSYPTEIKEEPKTFDEWWEENKASTRHTDWEKNYHEIKELVKDCHEWTIKNERLKHKPKITLKESIKSRLKNIDSEATEIDILFYREGWNACLKSHNLEE